MSVEQTTQLIQLILNSVLMTFACVLLLGRINLRQITLEESLQIASRQCVDLLEASEGRGQARSDAKGVDRFTNRILQAKKSLRQLQHRYKVVRYGVFANTYALLCAIASTLALAVRTLIDLEWLVPISLGLFMFGVTLLLLGVVLTLIDLHTADRSLWHEIAGVLSPTRLDHPLQSSWQQRSKIADRFMRSQPSKMRPASKARVS